MHLGTGETKQTIEHQRMKRRTQLLQTLGRAIQHATLICWTDNEHAHVLARGLFDRSPVVLEEVVPVEVHVLTHPQLEYVQNVRDMAVRGETDMTNATFLLPL